MNGPSEFELISPEVLVDRARAMHAEGCRLVQICATTLPEALELTYSFELKDQLRNLRLLVPQPGARVPSISKVFWCAFVYENELHDLFGLEVEGMAIDFHGKFYTTAVKFPFGSTKAPGCAPASTPAPAVRVAPSAAKPGGNGSAPATTASPSPAAVGTLSAN